MKYIASFEYGHANISSFEVEKETEKSIKVRKGSSKILIGNGFYLIRIDKNYNFTCDTLADAALHCMNKAIEYRRKISQELQDANNTIQDLRELYEAAKEKEI